jgi:hypothetical protein
MARVLQVLPQQRGSRHGLSGSAVYRWLWLRDLILGGSFLFLWCALLVLAASRWTAPLTPVVAISLSPLALPLYAGYSLLRMLLAYGLALLFTLLYGHVAATNRQAERVLIPLLDLLQSIPSSPSYQRWCWLWWQRFRKAISGRRRQGPGTIPCCWPERCSWQRWSCCSTGSCGGGSIAWPNGAIAWLRSFRVWEYHAPHQGRRFLSGA